MIGCGIVALALLVIYVMARNENRAAEERAWARKIARRYSDDHLPEPKKNGTVRLSGRSAPGAYTRTC